MFLLEINRTCNEEKLSSFSFYGKINAESFRHWNIVYNIEQESVEQAL